MNEENAPSVIEPKSLPPQKIFWQTHARTIIIGVCAIIIAGAAVVTSILLNPPKPTKQASQTSIARAKTDKPQQTTSPNTINTWKSTVNPQAIPLGDGHISTSPKAGYIMSCTTNFRGGGAMRTGSWINTANGTWDSETKVAVSGSVNWEQASYAVSTSGNSRILKTNDLPLSDPTGIFPIQSSDPAWQYDRNPNTIIANDTTYTLPLNPVPANSPSCTNLGAIGVINNGVFLFNGLDAAGRDAVAYETQDSCSGHPDGQKEYHYHDVPRCVMDRAKGSSTLVGYALDGYGIYVERDAAGNLPTNADLDECHGRTSSIMWDGVSTAMYHYDATLEYPFTVGCYHGTPVTTAHQR